MPHAPCVLELVPRSRQRDESCVDESCMASVASFPGRARPLKGTLESVGAPFRRSLQTRSLLPPLLFFRSRVCSPFFFGSPSFSPPGDRCNLTPCHGEVCVRGTRHRAHDGAGRCRNPGGTRESAVAVGRSTLFHLPLPPRVPLPLSLLMLLPLPRPLPHLPMARHCALHDGDVGRTLRAVLLLRC